MVLDFGYLLRKGVGTPVSATREEGEAHPQLRSLDLLLWRTPEHAPTEVCVKNDGLWHRKKMGQEKTRADELFSVLQQRS